jgi:hypothetical protein
VLMNSGSPNLCRHRETRLGTVGLLELDRDRLRAEIVLLGHSPGAPNPGTAYHLEIKESRLIASSRGGIALDVEPR